MRTASLCSMAVLSALALGPAAWGGLINSDFETGDLSGWTVFQTSNGLTNEAVTMFDVAGGGTASYAAQFRVGQVVAGDTYEGGGFYQSVYLTAGSVDLSADIAVDAGSDNAAGGRFELLFDGDVVSSYTWYGVTGGNTYRRTLSGSVAGVLAGTHEVRMLITRDYTVPPSIYQYVDNVVLQAVPEPSSFLLVGIGLVALKLRRRRPGQD